MENALDVYDAIVQHLGMLPEAERAVYLEMLADVLDGSSPRAIEPAPAVADDGERPVRPAVRGKCPQPKVTPDMTC